MKKICSLLFSSLFCYAQDLKVDDLLNMSLVELLNVEVTTTSKYAEKIKDTPANVYVFTQEQIKERGYRSVADILKALPGVDVQKFARFSSSNIVTFRGHSDNNKFLLLQDGVRISSAGGEVRDLTHTVPLYYAKQVEVLMGPASVSYGADAFMGVINIITLDNDDPDILQVQASVGTDQYGYGYAHLHQEIGDGLQLSLGVQAYQSQNYDLTNNFPEFYPSGGTSPTGNPFEFPQDKTKSFFLKFKTSENWDFGLNYADSSSNTYFASLPTTSAFDKSSKELIQTVEAHARFQTQISSNLHSTSLVTLTYYELDNDTNYNNIFTDSQAAYKYAQSERVSFNQDFVYKLGESHIISFGAVYNHINSIPVGTDLPSPYDESKSPSEQNLNYPGTNLPIVFLENNHENYGIYLQDNWKINDKWRLVTGLRYDDDSFYGDNTSPRISMIYSPNEDNTFKLMYGHSFLAPSAELAFRNFGGFSSFNAGTGLWESFFFRAPNPDLEPEELRSLELNYEHSFNQKTHLKVSPFFTKIYDVVRTSADPIPQQFIPGADIGFTESNKNSGEIDLYGLDIGVENLSEFNNLRIRSWGYFSYLDGVLKEDGVNSELPLVAKYKLKGGATFTYAQDYILSPQFYWIGSTTNNEADATDPTKRFHVPSYFTADLHGEAKITKNLSIISDIYNLFDEKYTNAVAQGSNIALTQAPQPGILFTLGLYYKF